MKKRNILVFSSLFISLFIYLFYRTEKTVVIKLFLYTISPQNYFYIKEAVNYYLPLHSTIIYSLPEGLWVFCITLTSKNFYVPMGKRRIIGIYFPLIFCIGLEIFQLLNITNGRFDLLDIAVSVFFWWLGYFFFSQKIKKENIFSGFSARSMFCIFSYGIVYLAHVTK